MQPTLNIALRAARIASEQIARSVERLDIIKSEQQSVSEFITETTIAAEKSAAYHIHKAHPKHRVIGQHGGIYEDEEPQGDTEWHISPIDGLTNFANGLPLFAFTLVYREKGRNEHVVVINPITGEEFTASRGRGAQLNGKRIRVSDLTSLNTALIGCDYINNSQKGTLDTYLNIYRQISEQQAQIQSYGSAALTLAYVAAGRIDSCCMMSLSDWELNPGMLLIQEAGGLMGDFSGNSSLNNGNLVAGNPRMFKQVLQAIQPALTAKLKN